MKSSEIIERVKNTIMQEITTIEAIILFGSYARGKQRDISDIDIAIKTKEELCSEKMLEIKNKIEDVIGIDVHLINLNTINEDFKYEILLSGKTLYCQNEYEFEMYKLKMYSNYLLFSEDRKPIIDKIKNGGTLYGK